MITPEKRFKSDEHFDFTEANLPLWPMIRNKDFTIVSKFEHRLRKMDLSKDERTDFLKILIFAVTED